MGYFKDLTWQEWLIRGPYQVIVDSFVENFNNNYYSFIGWVFSQLTKLITVFPIDLMSNEHIFKLQAIFMMYSLFMLIILATGEGYKAIIGVHYTSLTTIMGRCFVAIIGAGLTMPIVIGAIKITNFLVSVVSKVGEFFFGEQGDLGVLLREFTNSGAANMICSILFLIAFSYFIMMALFKVGIRWFDLIMNMVSSPFAWAAYITDGTAQYLFRWMRSTGNLILINLVYTFYVNVISIIIMGPGPIESFGGWMARILLLLGGLYRLAYPPGWLSAIDTSASLGPTLRRVAKVPLSRRVKVR